MKLILVCQLINPPVWFLFGFNCGCWIDNFGHKAYLFKLRLLVSRSDFTDHLFEILFAQLRHIKEPRWIKENCLNRNFVMKVWQLSHFLWRLKLWQNCIPLKTLTRYHYETNVLAISKHSQQQCPWLFVHQGYLIKNDNTGLFGSHHSCVWSIHVLAMFRSCLSSFDSFSVWGLLGLRLAITLHAGTWSSIVWTGALVAVIFANEVLDKVQH